MGKLIYISGLSGAGKTTIAKELQKLIPNSILLDGDEIRSSINSDLGYTYEDKVENIRRNNALIKLLNGQGFNVICAFMASVAEERDKLFNDIDDVFKVQLTTPLNVCADRDVKGLYRKKPADFAGVTTEYNYLPSPDILLDTSTMSVDDCATAIIELMTGVQWTPLK